MWWVDHLDANAADMKKFKKCRNKFSTFQKLIELKRKGKYSFEINKYQSKITYDDIHFIFKILFIYLFI